MKVKINVEIELDGKYVEKWNRENQFYYSNVLFGGEEPPTIEEKIASKIEDFIYTHNVIKSCEAKVCMKE